SSLRTRSSARTRRPKETDRRVLRSRAYGSRRRFDRGDEEDREHVERRGSGEPDEQRDRGQFRRERDVLVLDLRDRLDDAHDDTDDRDEADGRQGDQRRRSQRRRHQLDRDAAHVRRDQRYEATSAPATSDHPSATTKSN